MADPLTREDEEYLRGLLNDGGRAMGIISRMFCRITTLEGRSGSCSECERLAREIDDLKGVVVGFRSTEDKRLDEILDLEDAKAVLARRVAVLDQIRVECVAYDRQMKQHHVGDFNGVLDAIRAAKETP